MAKKKRRRKKGKGGIIAILIAGVVAAGYFMRDCLPNWGMGGGGGSGSESADNNETTETQPAGEKGTVAIVVKGEQCTVGSATTPCPQACETIKQDKPAAEANVEIDSTAGTTGTVEALVECLEGAGYSVQVKSE